MRLRSGRWHPILAWDRPGRHHPSGGRNHPVAVLRKSYASVISALWSPQCASGPRHPEKLPIIWQEPLNPARPCLISDLEGQGSPNMSRRPGQHAKTTSGYDARHAKPGGPGPAALIGTAAKAGTASLVAGAAGSALALSGTATAASAATTTSTIPAGLVNARLVNTTLANASLASNATDVAAVKAAMPRVVVRAHHHHHPAVHAAVARSTYTVRSGDNLSQI